MKVLIVYAKAGNLEQLTDALAKGAESKGHLVTVKVMDGAGEMLTAHPYDLVLVGSPVLGVVGGKIAPEVKPFLSAMKRLDGKEAVAYTGWKLVGTDKAVRKLMGEMEAQGCMVKDFRAFHSVEEAREFGKNL